MAADDGGVIDDGVDRRSRATASRRSAGAARSTVPAGAKTVDVTGKTIIPGLIDAHAHGPQGDDEIVPQQNWSRDRPPGAGHHHGPRPVQPGERDLPVGGDAARGLILGPRIFSTGEIVYGARRPRLRRDRQLRRRARPRAPAEGAGRARHQELQPAAPRAAPAGRGGRRVARTCRWWPRAPRCSAWT